jgi:hypothetical protein
LSAPASGPRRAEASEESADDASLKEHCLSSERLWEGGFLKVHRDAVRLPDGQHATREYVMHSRAGVLHNAIAYSNESIEIWFARDLTWGARSLDEGEFLEVVHVSDASLAQAVRDGLVTDAKTMIGLMYLEKHRAGVWPLAWHVVAS